MKRRFIICLLVFVVSAINSWANDSVWEFNPYYYQYDMTVYIALSSVDAKVITDDSQYSIAAFCGDECRGIAETKTSGEYSYVYLRIRSNTTEGDEISFKVKNITTGRIGIALETICFKSEQILNFPSDPYKINVNNTYQVKFVINGVEQINDLLYGSTIIAPTDVEKVGYTFEKWVPEVDETVPDHDVTYTATYTVNQYTITFDTDGGNEINAITQDYGSEVSVPSDPTKTGYTFAGWDKTIPATMPAEDITIKALWTINKYKLTYMVDGALYKESEIEYGASIIPEDYPTKDGYTFSGWSDIPTTMPANDVTITGSFTENTIDDPSTIIIPEIEVGTEITAETADHILEFKLILQKVNSVDLTETAKAVLLIGGVLKGVAVADCFTITDNTIIIKFSPLQSTTARGIVDDLWNCITTIDNEDVVVQIKIDANSLVIDGDVLDEELRYEYKSKTSIAESIDQILAIDEIEVDKGNSERIYNIIGSQIYNDVTNVIIIKNGKLLIVK